MRDVGLRGAVRGRAFKATAVADEAAKRPRDLVNREFTATAPNQLWVADLTYVATWAGFVIEAVEFATLVWVDWLNNRRLLEPLGWVPPAQYEGACYAGHAAQAKAA